MTAAIAIWYNQIMKMFAFAYVMYSYSGYYYDSGGMGI